MEKARNSLNEALDVIVKKEQMKADIVMENDVNLYVFNFSILQMY